MKAPPVAQYLVQEILNLSMDDSQPKVQGSKKRESGTHSKQPLRRKQLDGTYRLPKSSRTQPSIPGDRTEDSYRASSDNSLVGGDSAKCEGDILEIVAKEVPQEGVQGQSSAHSRSIPSIGSESAPYQLKAACSSDGARKNSARPQPSATLDMSAKDSQTTSRPSGAEQRETALPGIDGKVSSNQATLATSLQHGTKLQETTLLGSIPSTPVRQINRRFQSPLSNNQTVTTNTTLFTPIGNGEVLSPLTEDYQTASPPDKSEMTLQERFPSSPSRTEQQQASLSNPASTQAQQVTGEQPLPTPDSQTTPSSYPPREAPTLTDMVAKAVHIICEMSRRQEVPTKMHSIILSTLRPNLGGAPTLAAVAERPGSIWVTSSPTAWSASMWIRMLEGGYARSKETTILNMIEWMGASEWFDAEIKLAKKAPPRTKRGALRKRLATIVLDRCLKEAPDTTVMESPGKLASKDNEDCPSSPNSTGIQRNISNTRRKKLNNIFHRGRTLRKLVQITHLGILFDPDIWYVLRCIHHDDLLTLSSRIYAKASIENIDKVVALFEADGQKMELLSILDEQVELLVNKGRPDPSRFFDSLESHSITPSEEVSRLRAEYGLERVSRYPVWALDICTDAVCSNNRNRCHWAAWILPSTESLKGSATFSVSIRFVMTILLW